MHRKGRGLVFLGCAVMMLVLAVQAPAATESLKDKVKEFDLENGMKFLVVERHEAPVAFCAIVFNVGSANEWPNVTGISHLLEHMMFKGTEMMGTTNFKKEKPYIEETDELGEQTIALRKEIGEWRFEIFEDYYRDVLNTFTEEELETIGTNKYEQNKLVVEKIMAITALPDSIAGVTYLIEDEGVNYLDKYIEYVVAWGEITRLLDEQRQYMVKDELWEAYMNNGSRFLNAGTSNDFTVYFVYLPSNRLELWMTMESDRMDKPIFREFWSERDVVMEERRLAENDPDDVLDETFNSVAFTASPYKWPVLGWMSDLQTTDRKELEEYHRVYYAPNNAVAVVIGDVDFEQVKKMAKKYYGPVKRQPQPPMVETREPEQTGERRVIVEHEAEPKLMMGFHKPTFPDPDALRAMVVNSILSSGRTSRLYKTVYEEQELVASPVRVYTGPGDRYDNLLVFTAMPRHPHTLEEVEAAILEQLELLKSEPVTDRELQRIKNQIDAQQIRQLGSNLGIAFTILMGQLYLGDYKAMFTMYDRIKDVTQEDVMQFAETYFTPKNRTVAYRVEIQKEEGAATADEGEQIDRQVLMQYIMSLGEEEAQEIQKKFMSMKSEQEAMEYAKELWERAKAAGYVKDSKE